MGNIADLYIRVSTDEQADKGYSQRNQEEMLRKYCINQSIEVRNIIYEDHSAKTFNRPEWKNLVLTLKKKKNNVNLILFTKWDRFSRNAGDAYQMINVLRGLGVEPQAIEQPLDLSIPENKMMLAFYLAAPEVENDRRALNVFYGMRRAKKEGRYMGLAPVAYENKTSENGKKYISPKEPDASVLRWAFNEIAKGIFNTEQVYKLAKEKGLKCSKNAFWQVIRNPLYCGKIFVPQFKDEESRFVTGQHEGIITEALYYEVQDTLDGRSRNYRPKIKTHDEFPIRGYLVCPDCGKILTGSKSKGRTRYYSYYHCVGGCTHRVNAEKVNAAILTDLIGFLPQIENASFYEEIISKQYLGGTLEVQSEKKQILSEIKDYDDRLSHTRDLLATRQIEAEDYRDIKSMYTTKISSLEAKLNRVNYDSDNIQDLIKQGISKLITITKSVEKGELSEMSKDIGSIYPEKITFSESEVRTTRRNDFIHHINLINKKLHAQKNGTKIDFSTLSRQVGVAGFEPTTSTSQMWRDTGLRYTPKRYHLCFVWHKSKLKICFFQKYSSHNT
ncbi:Resolvase domain [Sphingobacterium multivorum]|uniref:Resolvase domain n=1 Tax=Sphingobacterium multivorum TaxID=28454 RepID=A0A653ZQZ1_SPHMU|nr:Resolvase domain [Sphingobacterium multivorum]